MKVVSALISAIMILSCSSSEKPTTERSKGNVPFAIVIHGGAGNITPAGMTPEKEKLYHGKLREALDAGYQVLEGGGSSADAVIAAITLMEDSPLFNAGKGAVFTHEGTNEMDASIMRGEDLSAGAVAGVRTIKNPIRAALEVMTQSEHVFLTGKGAEEFAQSRGLDIVDPSYFFDSARFEQFQKLYKRERSFLSEDHMNEKFGTVGCVAIDAKGNIAAGTSTGGMTNKKFGRVGDSPVIGAGTYASNATCGISATGHGEYFIRLAVAHEISAMMEHGNASLDEAARRVIMEKLQELGGTGGVIGLSATGDVAMVFNTEGMFRGFRKKGQDARTFLYKDQH